MQVNQATLESLYKGYRSVFFDAYHGQASGLTDSLVMAMPTQKASEVIAWLGAVPGMKKFQGEAQIENLAASAFEITVEKWHDTIGIPREDIERNSYGVYDNFLKAMGISAGMLPEEQLAALFTGGFDSKCYTGKNFFDANHEPQKGGTKFSNKGAKKLSATNFQTARANIKSRLNAKGKPMGLGKKLVLIVSPDYEATARSIVVADTVGGGNTNVDKGTARLEVWPQLAATPHNWFLVDESYSVKPFIRLDEKKLEFNTNSTALNSLDVMLTQQFIYQGFCRQGFGYGLPELVYGSTGADAA